MTVFPNVSVAVIEHHDAGRLRSLVLSRYINPVVTYGPWKNLTLIPYILGYGTLGDSLLALGICGIGVRTLRKQWPG